MSSKIDMRTQIVARLSGAHFPIRDPEELMEAWGVGEPARLDLGETSLNVEEVLNLLSPRDYLFTNPWQVADLQECRVDFPTHAVAVHQDMSRKYETWRVPGIRTLHPHSCIEREGNR